MRRHAWQCAVLGLFLLPAMPGAASQPQRTIKPASQKLDGYQVAAGTALLLTLQTPLNSSSATVDQQVDATLWSPVVQDNVELVPLGSKLFGRVAAVEPATERQRRGTLTLAFSIIEHAETGDRATLNTRSIVIEAPEPAPTAGKKVKARPVDAVLAEGARLVAVTAAPLLVRIAR